MCVCVCVCECVCARAGTRVAGEIFPPPPHTCGAAGANGHAWRSALGSFPLPYPSPLTRGSLQASYRARRARGYVRMLVEAIYRKYFDEASGYFYYYNTTTRGSSWSKPKTLRRGSCASTFDLILMRFDLVARRLRGLLLWQRRR